jgi:hypothetical protein
MPAVSLVICVHNERSSLERLLRESAGCYDDLVVVHDGTESNAESKVGTPADINEKPPAIDYFRFAPSSTLPEGYSNPSGPPELGSVCELTEQHGGRYFEGPRFFQQEPHWPFAWQQARYDWILRLDADEVPSTELRKWLRSFRGGPEPDKSISGYSCVWPLWNGNRAVSMTYPRGRIFLFDRQRVRFFGMVEQVPVPDSRWEPLSLRLAHCPARRSYGFANLLLRRRAYRWRRLIAESLLGKPTNLPRWRWTDEKWPPIWEDVRRRPLQTGLYRLCIWPIFIACDMWRADRWIVPSAVLSGGVHHCLIAVDHWWLKHFK